MTLNIQMSLHPITLAEYLSAEVTHGPPRFVKVLALIKKFYDLKLYDLGLCNPLTLGAISQNSGIASILKSHYRFFKRS